MITVPLQDKSIFYRLPKPAQEAVDFWSPIVNEVIATRPTLGVTPALEKAAKSRGVPYSTLSTKYYAAAKLGWRGLVDGQRLGKNRAVNPAFLDYWHGLVLANQRDTARAFSRFVSEYHRGEPIPGLPPADERTPKLPRGYGKRNLIRPRYLPKKAVLVMARQGVAAARTYLPHGEQDISHIRPLEYILFDDVELDFMIVVPECPTPVKLRLIVAMDLCSRVILGYGIRPAIPRPDGVDDGLKLRDMKAVVARLLRTWGVPSGYLMHLICERGTAALPEAAKVALAEISGGQIVVHDTSMVVGQVFEFRDRATGNSWGKAWLESFFKSLHSELADLPGQKGRRYDLAPAELDGRRKELAQLVKLGRRLPIELRYTFQWPFKTPAEAMQELDAAFARLHARRDHNLNCFERIALWRLTENDIPKPESELPEVLMDRVDRLLWDTSQYESPMERFRRLLPSEEERSPMPDCSLQRLMEEQRRVLFNDLQFGFERERTDYVYLPTDALLPLLTENVHYLLWFHPADMGTVFVTRDRPHLGYVGKLTRFTAGRRGDLEDAKTYLRDKQRLFNHAASRAQQPAIDRLRQRGDALASNTEIVERISSLETEVEVVRPGRGIIETEMNGSKTPDSIRAMTSDMAETAAQRTAAQKFDVIADTLNRPRRERVDASDAWT